MRTKTLGGRRRAPSAARSSIPTIPLLSTTTTQDEYNAIVFDTSSESDDDLRDVPMADSIDQHEYIDLLDKNICICCNKSGAVLACSEGGCPVSVHAKCIGSEPKFDDFGNFYCPYCWYKRAVEKSQELRKKAMIAKKALSSFLDENVVKSDKTVQADEAAKRKEPLAGDGISVDGNNRQGSDGVDSQPSQPDGDQPRKLHKADSDQCGIALEGQAGADGDFKPCSEEEMPVHIKLVQDSTNWEKFDKPNISETHVTKSMEGKQTEDSTNNTKDVHETAAEVGEEAEPLSTSRLGKHTDGHSPDIAFAKGMQESVSKSAKGMIKDKGKVHQQEEKMSATVSSVSETNDSEPEAILVKVGHDKQKVQKTRYPQKVASVRKSLLQEHDTTEKNACDINEEVTSSRTLRERKRSPQHVKNQISLAGRRRRLLWTAEEENALKEGVLKFSTENQNIPWRKILEFGCRVFDKTRTPVDLKDKWRNITSKEGCK